MRIRNENTRRDKSLFGHGLSCIARFSMLPILNNSAKLWKVIITGSAFDHFYAMTISTDTVERQHSFSCLFSISLLGYAFMKEANVMQRLQFIWQEENKWGYIQMIHALLWRWKYIGVPRLPVIAVYGPVDPAAIDRLLNERS